MGMGGSLFYDILCHGCVLFVKRCNIVNANNLNLKLFHLKDNLKIIPFWFQKWYIKLFYMISKLSIRKWVKKATEKGREGKEGRKVWALILGSGGNSYFQIKGLVQWSAQLEAVKTLFPVVWRHSRRFRFLKNLGQLSLKAFDPLISALDSSNHCLKSLCSVWAHDPLRIQQIFVLSWWSCWYNILMRRLCRSTEDGGEKEEEDEEATPHEDDPLDW